MNNKNLEIGQRVKQIRVENGLNQEAFGKRLGVTGTAISRIENGDRKLTSTMEMVLCREFNVSGIWLTEGIGESKEVLSVGNELATYMGAILGDENHKKQQIALIALRLVDEDWEMVSALLDKVKEYTNTNFDEE